MAEAKLPVNLEKIGRYRIIRPLSKGGMALVFEARRESLAGVSPRVAIKLILPEHAGSSTFREMFINEARLGASMHHQNLVQIQDFDADGDRYFLVMEYVEGLTLRKVISLCHRNSIQVPLGVIAESARQACDGLHYAHRASDEEGRHLRLVHRDIKPSNLILNPQGVVKVLDFGISKGRLRQERKGSVKGTWGYMAPEQAFGREVGSGADVFGLGCVIYEMAALSPIFKGKDQAEIKRLLNDDHAARMAATLDTMYAPLIPVLVRALQRDPAARYQTAEDFARALSALLPDPITARDEVVRFYQVLDAVNEGRPIPPVRPPNASLGGTHPSMAADTSRTLPASGWSTAIIATAVIGAGLVAVLLSALVLLAVTQLRPRGGDAFDLPVRAHQGAPADEPPGPAGEGAPGEDKPAARPVRRVPSESIPAPTAPKVIRVPKPTPKKVVVTRPAPVAPAAKPGVLTVGSLQQGAEVYIDGKFQRTVPLKKDLPPGSYVVTIVARDGRRKSFRVEMAEGAKLRKVWDFDRARWR